MSAEAECPDVPDPEEVPPGGFPPWPDDLEPEDLMAAALKALRKLDPENNDTQ